MRRVDAPMSTLVRVHGPCALQKPRTTRFESLSRAIISQQLAGPAARAIYKRFVSLLDGSPTAEKILALSEKQLRAQGVSGPKIRSLKSLASHVHKGSLKLRTIHQHDDETVIELMTEVHGIGRWTAQMFLLFQLGRPDIWPAGDLGVRKGYCQTYQFKQLTAKALGPLGDRFRPFRSAAAWYFWRCLD